MDLSIIQLNKEKINDQITDFETEYYRYGVRCKEQHSLIESMFEFFSNALILMNE